MIVGLLIAALLAIFLFMVNGLAGRSGAAMGFLVTGLSLVVVAGLVSAAATA